MKKGISRSWCSNSLHIRGTCHPFAFMGNQHLIYHITRNPPSSVCRFWERRRNLHVSALHTQIDTVHNCFSQNLVAFNAFYLFTQDQQCVPTPTVNTESCLHREGSICGEHVLSAPGSSCLFSGTPQHCCTSLPTS